MAPISPPAPRLVLAFAGVFALLVWHMTSPDMWVYLTPWYNHILESGRVQVFAHPFSNYSPPYLYLLSAASLLAPYLSAPSVIKLLGVALTVPLAFALRWVFTASGVTDAGRWTCLTLVLPAVVINAPLLAQCDALWSAACLAAVAAAIARRPATMAAFAGAAFAIKAQSAFVAPVILATLIAQRAPLRAWLAAPAAFAALLLPAWLIGWPLADLLTVYVRQAEYKTWAGSLPNLWLLHPMLGLPAGAGFIAGYVAALGFVTAYLLRATRGEQTPERLVKLALLSALAIPFLLPKMHERFWFLADMLAFALAVVAPGRRNLVIAAGVQIGSLIGMLAYLVDIRTIALLGIPFAMTALILLAKELLFSGMALPRPAHLSPA
jgi:Gpi18-like mannosyltransferase